MIAKKIAPIEAKFDQFFFATSPQYENLQQAYLIACYLLNQSSAICIDNGLPPPMPARINGVKR